jgi:hypothetical protein
VFCGKGSDFHDYVLEWSGPVGLVIPLLSEARRRGWCGYLLVPPGGEKLAERLDSQGMPVLARTAGYWLVTDPEQLSRYLNNSGMRVPRNPDDPKAILGTVDRDGVVVPGALNVAVWGFDSV